MREFSKKRILKTVSDKAGLPAKQIQYVVHFTIQATIEELMAVMCNGKMG